MKTKLAFMLTGMLVINQLLVAQVEGPGEDRTLSPYFYIPSEDSDNERLPLKSTSAEVSIAGVIADLTVIQEYKNEGKKPIEAIYVFPASTRAAVYSMVMTIGDRVVLARIEQKEKARQDYEEAKKNGQSASLLEQERPNVFMMNVANIMPGDLIKVEMKYTEVLIPEERIYQFVFPTVVGPRYSGGNNDLASADDGWNANPYTLSGVKPLYSFDIQVTLHAGMAIKDLRCTSHQTTISYIDKSTATVDLASSEISGGNRDFILQYRLSGHNIETGVLTFRGEKENFFLAMIQPPDRVAPEMMPPREYIFIMDVSGSMYGYPIETSKKLLKDLISGLKTTDRFNVILFAGGSEVYSGQSVAANQENIRSALTFIDRDGGGGTELLPALRIALGMKCPEGFSRTFIIATDGYVTVEKEAIDLVRENLGTANFFTFGIGSGVNRYLIEGLAHAGQGEPFVITRPEEASAVADKFRKYISSPVMTDVRVAFEGFDVYDLAQESYPDIFAERPVIIFGKYRGTPRGGILVTGTNGNGKIEQRVDLASVSPDQENSVLRYLWAREKIRQCDDLSNLGYGTSEVEQEVTRLGLDYNLLTNYTSFIAIDTEVRNHEGIGTTVSQPLPLPDGVSNYAVGGCVAGVSQKSNARGNRVRSGNFTAAEATTDLEYDVSYNEPELKITAPEFIGGEKALETFIKSNLKYPEESRNNGIKGKAIVEFYVNADGSVADIQILYSLDKYTDQEVIRLVRLMSGKWKPGEEDGIPVKARVVLSQIEFR
jgi:Ca-activated chloride channel family protein